MKAEMFGCLMLWLAGTCSGQEAMPLCPRHIETPIYPTIARTANVYGKVFLTVTVDEAGKLLTPTSRAWRSRCLSWSGAPSRIFDAGLSRSRRSLRTNKRLNTTTKSTRRYL